MTKYMSVWFCGVVDDKLIEILNTSIYLLFNMNLKYIVNTPSQNSCEINFLYIA